MSVRISVSEFGAGSLAARVGAAPFVEPDDVGLLDEWLAGNTAAADILRPVMAANPALGRLLAGIGRRSPYLWGLGSANPERLVRILVADPDSYFTTLLDRTAASVSAAPSEADAMRLLREMKAEAALLIAVADIGGVWPVMRVTAALTELADCAVRSALRYLLNEAVRRGTIRALDVSRPETGSGYFALAMGKMGAGELNYSSDIDLIVLFDPDAPAVPAEVELAAVHIRLTRGLVKLLQERTPEGYVFRVDLRLRPDPASTQIAISTASALDYYEHRGQNWERSAMIKARVCAGDSAAGEAFLKALTPFVWRKYMDFAAVADIHAMKRQIHAYKGHGEIAVEGFNIKLGRGGIREIEFFVQTQQLIAGGRHPELRDPRTLATLAALVEGGWIEADARDDLERAYLFLRTIEHRLQMVADEQTHSLPVDAERMRGFARFCGYADRDAFAEALVGHLRKVQVHYARLFELTEAAAGERLLFKRDADDRGTLDRLTELGFRNPLEISATVRAWLAGRMPALRSEFAREQLQAFIPPLLTQLARAENRDAALASFERFLSGLHPGGAGRLFSLLRQNPGLLALFMLILSNAPRLADILAGHPQVIDGLIDPAFFGAVPDADKLRDALQSSLAQSNSYEDYLDRLRLFGQEHMFLIGARILSGTLSAELAGQAFARLADVIIRDLHREVEEKFAHAHGRIKGQSTALLAMGKLGGREMTATSDLDLILVYDFDEAHPESDGPRPLYGAQYFARLTQRLISALTARTNYGALYQVDMRLRPSGRSGPVATQLASFRHYQEHDAWTWEHMALTRARVVSATPGFAAAVQEVIETVLRRPRNHALIAGDALEMRNAIAQEKRDDDRWDLKYAAGGLIDVEFLAQYLQLVYAADHPALLDTSTAHALEKATRIGLLAADDAEILRAATQLYQDLSQILRLCMAGKFEPDKAGAGLLELLARAADVPNFTTLDAYLVDLQPRVRRSFLRILNAPAAAD